MEDPATKTQRQLDAWQTLTRHRHQPDPRFGPALRAARRRCGWSLYALAAGSGLSVGFLSLLENGRRAPSVVSIDALAAVLVLTSAEAEVFVASGVRGVGRDWRPRVDH